jgi:hypothetical protein
LVLASTVACHDSTGPSTITAQFDLTDIDGRPVPTYPAPTPGLTPTIISEVVTLNTDGTAVIVEHLTEWDGTDATFETQYLYGISNGKITFRFKVSCPPGADCLSAPEGTIFGSRLSLVMGALDNVPIIYNFSLKT